MKVALPFAVASLLATVTYLGIMVSLHIRPTGYEPVRDAVSDYGVGRFGTWFAGGLWASAAGVLALAVGLEVEVGSPRLPGGDLLLLGLIAAPRAGMAVFPTSLEGKKLTRTALVHYAFAIAAFTLTYLALTRLTPPLQITHPWNTVHDPLGWLSAVIGVELGLVVITVIGPLRRVFGLFERIFLITTNLWFLFVAAGLVVAAR